MRNFISENTRLAMKKQILLLITMCFALLLNAQVIPSQITLPNGWKLSPVGKSFALGDLPLNIAVSKSGNLLAVTNNGQSTQSIQLIDAKTEKVIDSVAKITGVEGRLIVSCLAGEQIRLFNSRRESFKKYISPLQSLVLENNLSYGVTGIKEHTAMNIERYLKDPNSEYYLGKKYEHLLDYDSTQSYINSINDTMNIRLRRLVQFNDHYYSYLYAALFVKQIKMQWERAGYPLDNRPEILASLFNLGYSKSKPKKYPSVGGSNYQVGESQYTFGAVAFEFYYSGELLDVFPYQKKRFDWDTN